MDSLDEALTGFASSLDALKSGRETEITPPLMQALLARDRVAQEVSKTRPLPAAMVTHLAELDERLQKAAPAILRVLDPSRFHRWRETLQPSQAAWWWWLDDRVAASQRLLPLWTLLAGFCITVSISLSAEISRRFLSVGADFISVFSTLSQAALTLAAGSALTDAGRGALGKFFERLGIERVLHPMWRAALALLLLLAVLALRLSLPRIAVAYNNQGLQQQIRGQVTSAITSYQRSISLHPDYALAHYNLAVAYEEVLDYDKALAEYHTALAADPKMYYVYNNLARLYLLRRQDYASALEMLNDALALEPPEASVRYSLFKNRAWAYVGLNLLTLAETDVRHAQELEPNGAAAHCLLGQMLEAQGKPDEAVESWERCVGYATPDGSVPPEWYALAQDRLSQGGTE